MGTETEGFTDISTIAMISMHGNQARFGLIYPVILISDFRYISSKEINEGLRIPQIPNPIIAPIIC
jgi:hypothetical protein